MNKNHEEGMTASQFCTALLKQYAAKKGLSHIQTANMYESSSVAVAMEYLGLLDDPKDRAYAAERSGILYHYIAELPDPAQSFLTVRDMIRLLEDREEREKEDYFGLN